MTTLWTPFDAERSVQIDHAASQVAEARRITRELKQMDPYLEVCFVGPRAPGAPGVVPGAWHVRRTPPDAMDNYWPILNADGSPASPSMKIVEDMKEADLWRAGALQELRDRQEREAKKKAHDDDLFREQARDEAALTWRAGKRVAGEGGMDRRKWAKK